MTGPTPLMAHWSRSPDAADWAAGGRPAASPSSGRCCSRTSAPTATRSVPRWPSGSRSRTLGRKAVVSFGDDPFEVPGHPATSCRGSTCSCRRPRSRSAPELVVTFDASSIDRLGLVAPNLASAAKVVALDHHTSYTGFADIHIVDTSAARHRGARPRARRPARGDVRPLTSRRASTPACSPTPAPSATPRRPRTTHGSPRGCSPPACGTTRSPAAIYDTTPFGYLRLLGARAGPGTARPARRRRARPGVDHGAGGRAGRLRPRHGRRRAAHRHAARGRRRPRSPSCSRSTTTARWRVSTRSRVALAANNPLASTAVWVSYADTGSPGTHLAPPSGTTVVMTVQELLTDVIANSLTFTTWADDTARILIDNVEVFAGNFTQNVCADGAIGCEPGEFFTF